MKIGILGTGNVGQALGLGFATLGHEVKMGSRDPQQEKIKDWVHQAGA
ncbi:MAG: NAD(P)-binding domain-containing protein, partial [Candidatus Competibacter sp.]|nr:NAD(P)-binding domain-containing protein [Candidatus Competibacter sp.]